MLSKGSISSSAELLVLEKSCYGQIWPVIPGAHTNSSCPTSKWQEESSSVPAGTKLAQGLWPLVDSCVYPSDVLGQKPFRKIQTIDRNSLHPWCMCWVVVPLLQTVLDGTSYSSELPREVTASVGGNTCWQLTGFCRGQEMNS